jgi:hypothetical protein
MIAKRFACDRGRGAAGCQWRAEMSYFVFQRCGGGLVCMNIELLCAAPLKNKKESIIQASFL